MELTSTNISVIISSRDNAREALSCIRSLLRYGPKVQEVILATRGASVENIHKIKSFLNVHGTMQLLQYPETFSEAKVRNLAAKKAKGELLFFTNDSVRFHRASAGLLEYMSERALLPKTGAVGCLVLAKDKKTIRHAGIFKLPNQPFHTLYFGYKIGQSVRLQGTRTFPYSIQRSRAVLALAGPILISRKAFRATVGFDEKYELDAAQATVEFCLRLHRANRPSWYCAGGTLLDYSEVPKPAIDLPMRLNVISPELTADPYLPKLSEPNLRVPRANRSFIKDAARALRKGFSS